MFTDTPLCSFLFFVPSLSSFGIRVMLALYNRFRSVPFSSTLWKRLYQLAVFLLYNWRDRKTQRKKDNKARPHPLGTTAPPNRGGSPPSEFWLLQDFAVTKATAVEFSIPYCKYSFFFATFCFHIIAKKTIRFY